MRYIKEIIFSALALRLLYIEPHAHYCLMELLSMVLVLFEFSLKKKFSSYIKE